MNNLTAIIAALGGTGAIAALVTTLTTYLKTKTAAEERKKGTAAAHREMAADMDELRSDQAEIRIALQTFVEENAALRDSNAAKDKKITQLETIIARQAAALPPAIKVTTRKD